MGKFFILFCIVDFVLVEYSSAAPLVEDTVCLAADENCNKAPSHNEAAKDSAQASNIAQKAAQEAKAAEDAQQQAAAQAAHQVKEQLAEKAVEAAKAAEAALAGKEALVSQLQEEIQQADLVIQEEANGLAELQSTAQASLKSLQEARAEVKLLSTALQLAEGNAQNAALAETGVQQQVQEKEQLLDAARARKEELNKELSKAKSDLKSTKDATKRADVSAADAKQNAGKSRKRSCSRID